MNKFSIIFMTWAAICTGIFLYSMGVMVFYEYSRYLHDVATYSLLGIIIGYVFGFLFDDSQNTSKESDK